MRDYPDFYFYEHITIFHWAIAPFHTPCHKSGEMARERIQAAPNWRGEGPRNDIVFIHNAFALDDTQGIHRFHIGRVRLFLPIYYSCALIEWFYIFGDSPDEDTEM